jgi:hypothetical protein
LGEEIDRGTDKGKRGMKEKDKGNKVRKKEGR